MNSLKRENKKRKERMEYLFLRRKKTTATSERQKRLLLSAAGRQWEEEIASRGMEVRKADSTLYKGILYQLEIRRAFLDVSLSLKKLSVLLETNQTYLSNAVNRYFGCNLNELVNTYRVEYAKELLRSGQCPKKELPARCGFASSSAFYAAFGKITGGSPSQFVARMQRRQLEESLMPPGQAPEQTQDNEVLL